MRVWLPLVCLAAGVAVGALGAATEPGWSRFGYDAARSGGGPATGITAANVRRLVRQRIALDGTVDSSPIAAGALIVVTTSYGKAIALDPRSGRVRWRFTPPGYASWVGSDQITNSSPVSDGRFVWT